MPENLLHSHHTSQCVLGFLVPVNDPLYLKGLMTIAIHHFPKSEIQNELHITSILTPSCPSELAVWCNPDLAVKPFTLTSPSALSIDFSFVYVHPSLSGTSVPVILLFSIELSHIGMGSWGTGETNQRSNVMEAPLTLTVPILRAVTHSRVVA